MQFENYDFRMFSSFKEMIERLRECEEKMGLCRLCGGYAWKWITQDTMEIPDLCIEDVGIYWNSQTGGWLRNDASKEEMGSIYSLAGLDLNYTAVVIGPDIYYDTKKRKIKVNKKHFFDNKVKKNVTDEELREYILNTYAVLLTRGIYGTYIYVCDDALREYLKRFIPVV